MSESEPNMEESGYKRIKKALGDMMEGVREKFNRGELTADEADAAARQIDRVDRAASRYPDDLQE